MGTGGGGGLGLDASEASEATNRTKTGDEVAAKLLHIFHRTPRYLSETNGLFAAGLEGLSEVVMKRKWCQILKGSGLQRRGSREVH